LPDEEDDFNFTERFATLTATLQTQMQQETELNKRITANLSKVIVNADVE
jgi:type I restriction enzyme M protein